MKLVNTAHLGTVAVQVAVRRVTHARLLMEQTALQNVLRVLTTMETVCRVVHAELVFSAELALRLALPARLVHTAAKRHPRALYAEPANTALRLLFNASNALPVNTALPLPASVLQHAQQGTLVRRAVLFYALQEPTTPRNLRARHALAATLVIIAELALPYAYLADLVL